MALSYPIFLVGFMGCGKSKLAKRLSSRFNVPHLDLDNIIEDELGTSIRAFVDSHGEEAFRKVERKLLLESFKDFKGIIALGGGAPCYQDNMQEILKLGSSVYLKYPAKTLVQRLAGGKAKRPLIASIPDDELQGWIEAKLKERASYYEQATVTFDFEKDRDAYSFMFAQLA